MKALALTSFTATSCIGRGVEATLAALRERRTGLKRCAFETVTLDAFVGEVAGVDEAPLPPGLREYECRNNRLAQLGLVQDGFAEAVRRSARRHGRERVGVFLGTSTSGILETELAYRRRDPASGALPARASMGMRCCCSGWANRATPTTCPLRIRRAAAPAPPCSRPSRPPRSIRPTSSTSTCTAPAHRATTRPSRAQFRGYSARRSRRARPRAPPVTRSAPRARWRR